MSTTFYDFLHEPRPLSVVSRRRVQRLRQPDQCLLPEGRYTVSDTISRSDISSLRKIQSGNFSFQSPSGRIVGFPRLSLLPRALEFTPPPAYDSLVAATSLPSPPASPWPTSRGRSPVRPRSSSPNKLVVHVRDISPVASQGSMPSYRALSPPPPRVHGCHPYIIAGMEIDDDEVMRQELHQFLSAPFVSHPDMPPCTAQTCPMRSTPHNQGLYFHYGMRPGPVLRDSLRHYGVNGIWDGENPPNLVWSCLVASLDSLSTTESRAILRNYMRLHCSAEGYYTSIIRRRDALQKAIRRTRRIHAQQRQREEEAVTPARPEMYTGPPEPVSRVNNPVRISRVEEEGSTDTNTRSVRGWAQDVAAAAPHTPQAPDGSVAGSERGPTDQRHEGGELDSVIDDRRTTTLTYWSSIPETHANFLKLGLLPPARHQASSSPSSLPTPTTLPCTSPTCPVRTADAQNLYTYPSHLQVLDSLQRAQRERVASFLDNVGLEGIWGDSYPDPTVFASLVRLVQDACLDLETDVGVVERFRALHVYGNRPVVVEGEEIGGGEGDEEGGKGDRVYFEVCFGEHEEGVGEGEEEEAFE